MTQARRRVSGARRTGQPRSGAPASRPRIGIAADPVFFTTRVLSGSLYLFDVAALRHYPPDLAESETFARALNQFEPAIR